MLDVSTLNELSKEELINIYQQLHAASKGLPMPQTGEIPPEDHKDAMQLFDLTSAARAIAYLYHIGESGSPQMGDQMDLLFESVKTAGLLNGLVFDD